MWNAIVGHGFHFKQRNTRMLPIIVDALWYMLNLVI
jgi:hypothetical protein